MSDEANKLRDAMSNLTNAVNTLSVKFDERSKTIDKDLTGLKNDMWGTGDSSPGIKAKVQTHETALLILKFLTGVIATAVISILIKIFWTIITQPLPQIH